MAHLANETEDSVSMGPAALISCEDGEITNELASIQHSVDPSFLSPVRCNGPHAMGILSLSSIPAVDTTLPGHVLSSPESGFRPDILMSTINTNKVIASNEEEELSISMGPLPPFSCNEESEVEQQVTSLASKIQKLDVKHKLATAPAALESKSIQTDEPQCLKCEELHLCYNQKLLEVANEFQKQYSSQFHMIEQHAANSEEAQKQITDLMDQLEVADKQLKASRVFLEQQAVEREQEREEAIDQLNKLKNVFAEKDKECERVKASADQMAADLQQLHDLAKEKDQMLQESCTAQQHLEQELQMLRISQSDLVEENSSLQAILEVKDKLLKAQAEQITALQTELENHVFGQSESERENESHSAENHRNSSAKRRETDDNSFTKKHIEDVPSLFQELQKVIVSLLHKVDNSTRALEAAQWTKQPKTTTNNNLLLSPRSFVTPCTSTEDISVRDRNQTPSHDHYSPSPSPSVRCGQNDPELALSFLQELDGKLAVLSRIEEAACKRIADLEAELARISDSEKQTQSKSAELEQQCKRHQQLAQEIEAEKRELQSEHTELLKRISSLENRLEEQRRSAALGASQNIHAEKCRSLSEEKRQLLLVVQEKEESLTRMQDQMGELHQRIDKLMKTIQDHEASVRRPADFSQSSIERLRDAPHQDGSMTWSRLQMNHSPVPTSPIYQNRTQKQLTEIPQEMYQELEDVKSKLQQTEKQRQTLEDELAGRMAQFEALEQRVTTLDDARIQVEKDKHELEKRYALLEEELSENRKKLENIESVRLQLEKEVEEIRAAHKTCGSLEKELTEQKQSSQRAAEELKKRCNDLELARSNLKQEYDIIRRRCLVLEAETIAQRGTVTAMEVLQQRCASLQADLVNQQEWAQQQCADLKARLLSKEQMVSELEAKLRASDGCKVQVEQALKQLQAEVDAIKRAQQMREILPTEPRECSTLLEGPAAPPDLLAPSFVELLGSTSSSRCSSRPSSTLAHRTTESSTMHDFSLPNSMVGKQVLKDLQKESEQLLAFGKELLEMQQRAAEQKAALLSSAKPTVEAEDLEMTLKPDGTSFDTASSARLAEMQKKVELLEMQLAMERLLLKDQRQTNARQQQQMMQLMAKQRSNSSSNEIQPKSAASPRSLQPSQVKLFMQYRTLKLESIRKNLIYQKKFLTGIVHELDQNHNERLVANRWNSKSSRRFRIVALAIVSIGRMRYIVQQWRLRRRMLESQSPTD